MVNLCNRFEVYGFTCSKDRDDAKLTNTLVWVVRGHWRWYQSTDHIQLPVSIAVMSHCLLFLLFIRYSKILVKNYQFCRPRLYLAPMGWTFWNFTKTYHVALLAGWFVMSFNTVSAYDRQKCFITVIEVVYRSHSVHSFGALMYDSN